MTVWTEIGIAELRSQADSLFQQMMVARPTDSDWERLRKLNTLLFDLQEYQQGGAQQAISQTAAPPDTDLVSAFEPGSPQDSGVVEPEHHEACLQGVFHRELRGGTVWIESGIKIPVPESARLATRMEHLDTVEVVRDGEYDNGQPRYFFTVITSAGTRNQNRKELLGLIDKSERGEWRVTDGGLTVRLGAVDVDQHSVVLGSVVTVAYMADQIRLGRAFGVIDRVHETTPPADAARSETNQRRKVEPACRDKETLAEIPTVSSDVSASCALIGQPRVLIVGGRNWQYYRDGIQLMGGKPTHLEGFGPERDLAEDVQKADIIVCIKPFCSHSQYNSVKAAAKSLDRLFFATDKENWSGLRGLFERKIAELWNDRQVSKAG